jgi:AraC-like DNA-binding protein
MEFHQLRSFVATAEELSITAAARRVHLSQPALSRQIQSLEEELGVALFDRVRQRIHLTAAGRYFLDRARQMLCDAETSAQQVREQFGDLYAQAGLLVTPSIAYMYTFAEIAAELALETHGVDVLETATICRNPRGVGGGVTVGSTASIIELLRADQRYLWEKQLVPHAQDASFNVVDPSFMQPVFSLPWGGTSLPIFCSQSLACRSYTVRDSSTLERACSMFWRSCCSLSQAPNSR